MEFAAAGGVELFLGLAARALFHDHLAAVQELARHVDTGVEVAAWVVAQVEDDARGAFAYELRGRLVNQIGGVRTKAGDVDVGDVAVLETPLHAGDGDIVACDGDIERLLDTA